MVYSLNVKPFSRAICRICLLKKSLPESISSPSCSELPVKYNSPHQKLSIGIIRKSIRRWGLSGAWLVNRLPDLEYQLTYAHCRWSDSVTASITVFLVSPTDIIRQELFSLQRFHYFVQELTRICCFFGVFRMSDENIDISRRFCTSSTAK